MGGQQIGQLGFPGPQVELPFAASANPGRKLTIGIVSTYPPRRCGIATFTKDLFDSLNASPDECKVIIGALEREEMNFGSEVVVKINPDVPADYHRAAKVFAKHHTDVVIIEHEYGIYGEKHRDNREVTGAYVLELANGLVEVGIPYVPTLHTVLAEPGSRQRAVLKTLCENAAAVTVFTDTARELMVQTGLAEPEKLVIMPHGAPIVIREGQKLLKAAPAKNPNCRVCKTLSDLGGRRILSTFGLIGAGKGIENTIEALPKIVEKHPDVCYLVAGATHPELIRTEGETYRQSLTRLVRKLKMQDQVRFIDAFITLDELSMLLGKTTLYVTPYRSRDQICSGALTFALAAGCPVVSTPYYYAMDVLKQGRGKFVPFNNPNALADAICGLLSDKKQLGQMREAADKFGA
jgi:glycosyltransferase involved in cell wall biosynthesis